MKINKFSSIQLSNIEYKYYQQGHPNSLYPPSMGMKKMNIPPLLIFQFFERYNKVEQLKLRSNIYRYNNTWQWLLKAYTGKDVAYLDGYRPMPVNETSNMKANFKEYANFVVDSTNLSLLNRMVGTCQKKKIKLVVTYTPTLSVCCHGFIDWASNYCKHHYLPFYNTMLDDDFLKHPELFYDYTHLNENGARIFTQKFAKWVNENLEK